MNRLVSIFFVLVIMVLGFSVQAQSTETKSTKAVAEKGEVKKSKTMKSDNKKAHVHGSGKVDIAFEGNNGKLVMNFPADSIYGFEYEPKTEDDKKKQHDALSLIETAIADMIVFNSDNKCEFQKVKIEADVHDGGKHADVDVDYNIVCDKSPIDSEVVFNFQKTFPNLKKVNVTFLADAVQKTAKANKDGTKLKIKK